MSKLWVTYYLLSCTVTLVNCYGLLSSNTTNNFPASELNILQVFYNATNGENWNWSTNQSEGIPWNFTTNANPCVEHWQGIDCSVPSPGEEYHVTEISFFSQNVSGSLPDSLYQLTNLTTLSLRFNRVNGTIPASYGKFANLQYLVLDGNRLSGSIPATLGNISTLLHFNLYTNAFSGPVPNSLCGLSQLQILDLKVNKFTGTLPYCLGEMSNLQYFNIHTNLLTGYFPDTIGQLTKLQVFDIGANQISGPLPEALYQLTSLNQLYCDVNHIHGTIPAILSQMTSLNAFYIDVNYITGTIPFELSGMYNVTDFYVDFNYLTGTIPPELSILTDIQYIFINNNFLTGVLPVEFGTLSSLHYLVVHDNMLHGTIPTVYNQLTSLMVLQLHSNFFEGSLNNLFNPLQQTNLATIQLNNNQFTGTLPSALFALPRLNTFVAVSNCFTGTLPPNVCDAHGIVSLILDGLSSADSCRNVMFPGISNSYLVTNTLHGTVPACLFYLNNLSTLHLSGNGFTGHLPDVDLTNSKLNDLSISHNVISGTIPSSIQERVWINLDLSFNRLSGTLRNDFGSVKVNFTELVNMNAAYEALQIENELLGYNILSKSFSTFRFVFEALYVGKTPIPSLSLENNRLSGVIPGYVETLHVVSVLSGNLFACQLDTSDLPDNDSEKSTYQCGSSAFDLPYYVWLGCVGLLIIAFVVIMYRCQQNKLVVYVGEWYIVYNTKELSRCDGIKLMFEYLDVILRTAVWCTMYILLILLPIYCILYRYYRTITLQYAWTVSAAYLSGKVSLALIFILLLSLLVMMGMYLQKSINHIPINDVQRGFSTDSIRSTSNRFTVAVKNYVMAHWRRLLIVWIYVWTNVIIVVGVNALFVYTSISSNNGMLLLAQILITLFKLAWNNVCSTTLIRVIVNLVGTDSVRTNELYARSDRFVALRIFVALLNNVVIPCFVVGIISPDCFYHVFDPPPKITSSYTYQQCVYNTNDNCDLYVPVITSATYHPPFRYSYQCSSSMITYYAPAFVILCLMTSVVSPLAQYLLVYTYKHAREDGKIRHFMDQLAPRILLPPFTIVDGQEKSNATLVDPNRELIRLISFLGLLLTFGAVFPPLAASLLGTILATVMLTKVKVGRFLSTARELNLPQYVTIIEKECQGIGSVAVLHNTVYILLTVCCGFYTLFLFDILGDSVGFNGAIWLIAVVPLMPIALYFAIKYLPSVYGDTGSDKNRTSGLGRSDRWGSTSTDVEIELRESTQVDVRVIVSPLQAP